MTRLPKILAVLALAVMAMAIAGCTSAQIRDNAEAVLSRSEATLDVIDRGLAVAETYETNQTIAVLPGWVRELIGDALPEQATIAEARAYLIGRKPVIIAEIDKARATIAEIDDADSPWAAASTIVGSLLTAFGAIGGEPVTWATIAGGVFAWVGRRFGQASGAKAVANSLNTAAAADPVLARAMTSGTASTVLRANAATLPATVRKAVAANTVSKTLDRVAKSAQVVAAS